MHNYLSHLRFVPKVLGGLSISNMEHFICKLKELHQELLNNNLLPSAINCQIQPNFA